jgi:cytochrome c biogenesis protein CcmG, thiol:disulfide interchange protein DsbE
MNRIAKFLIPLAIFFIVAGFLFKGLYLDPHEVPSPLVGKSAPVFQAPLLGEVDKTFNSTEMKGQVWLLNVWASWCGACREEHPVLMEMAKNRNIATYGLDYKDTDSDAQAVLASNGNPYRANFTDVEGKIGIDYGVYGVPETYVIDKAGVIRYKQIGPITDEILSTKILPLLNELEK